MISSIVVYALLALQNTGTTVTFPVAPNSPPSCPASYLKKLLSDTGVPESWVPSKTEFSAIEGFSKELIRDYPKYATDGFAQWLFLSQDGETAYVVQIGGYGGVRRVFGPFPAAKCKANNI